MTGYLSDEELKKVRRLVSDPKPPPRAAEAAAASPATAKYLGRYRLFQQLSPRSWLANAENEPGTQVVRILGTAIPQDRLSRILDAVRPMAGLSHPVLAMHYKLLQWRGVFFFVRPFVPGRNVARPDMPPETALEVAYQVAHAIQAAHAGGMAHGRLIPQNVILAPGGAAYVVDLALRWAGEVAVRKEPPPEPPRPEVDAVDLGILFLSLMSGKPTGDVVAEGRPPMRPISPKADPALAGIADRIVGTSPYASVAELAADLHQAIRALPMDHASDGGLLQRFARQAGRPPGRPQ